METARTDIPTIDLASLEGGRVAIVNDLPQLLIRAGGQAVVLRLVAGDDDHDETIAGIHRLMDGLRMLETSVAARRYRREREETAKRIAAQAEQAAVVDSDWAPDHRVADAMRRINERKPAITHLPSEFRTSGPYA